MIDAKMFAVWLKLCREGSGTSYGKFAKEIGVSKTYVFQIEHNKRHQPSFDFVCKAAEFFKVPLEDVKNACMSCEVDI